MMITTHHTTCAGIVIVLGGLLTGTTVRSEPRFNRLSDPPPARIALLFHGGKARDRSHLRRSLKTLKQRGVEVRRYQAISDTKQNVVVFTDQLDGKLFGKLRQLRELSDPHIVLVAKPELLSSVNEQNRQATLERLAELDVRVETLDGDEDLPMIGGFFEPHTDNWTEVGRSPAWRELRTQLNHAVETSRVILVEGPDALPVTSKENGGDKVYKLRDTKEVKEGAKAAHERIVDAMFAGTDHANYDRFSAGVGNQGVRWWLDEPRELDPISVDARRFKRDLPVWIRTGTVMRENPEYRAADKLDKTNRTMVVHAIDRRRKADQEAVAKLIDGTIHDGSSDHRLVLTVNRGEVAALEPELKAALERHAKTVRMPRAAEFAEDVEPILRALTLPRRSQWAKRVTHVGSLISPVLQKIVTGPHDISGLLNQREAFTSTGTDDTSINDETLQRAAQRISDAPPRSK